MTEFYNYFLLNRGKGGICYEKNVSSFNYTFNHNLYNDVKGDDFMCKQYTVCLCFGREHCLETTEEIAKKNNAIDWFIEPVFAPLTSQLAYRGTIVKEVD